jgi:AcrR family transcriptional regulator
LPKNLSLPYTATMKATGIRERQSRTTRDLILDAAERRFAERGFAGVSVREIATEAGLKNQASLYHHFKNKKALYEAVLARGIDPLIGMVAARGEADTEPATDPYLDRIVDYLAAHPQLPRLIQRAGLDDNKHLRATATRLLRPLYTQGLRVLASTGQDWDPSEMPHLAAGLYHLIFGYFANAALLETVLPESPRSPAAVERQRRFVKQAVARLLGARAASSAAESTADRGRAASPTLHRRRAAPV